MPIHFDDPGESDHPGSVAWLRFIKEERGGGIRAALFETSTQGEPLGFYFSRMDLHVPPPFTQNGDNTENTVLYLAKYLFRAAARTPDLIFGLASEIPARTFTYDMRVRSPFCRVKSTDLPQNSYSPNGYRERLIWGAQQTVEARRVLDEVLECDDPFESFGRAERGLKEAFADPRVSAMTAVPGLDTLISVSLPPDRWSAHSAAQGEQSHAALTERLWQILASSPRPRQDTRNPQLEWTGELMSFQKDGVRALLDMDNLLLADDMGLGKTIQAIAAMRILKARREIESCLVVAPASVLDQWRREIAKWAPELSAIIIRGSAADRSWQWDTRKDVILTSYETLTLRLWQQSAVAGS